MPGENESQTPASQMMDKTTKRIDQYTTNLGLPTLTDVNECESLNLTGQEITSMTQDERDEHAADLANYGIYIQRTLGREKALLNYLVSKINITIANELNSYAGYYSHEQRRSVAIVNNAYAKELENFRMNSQIKVDMLEGLTFQINQLCRVLQKEKVKSTWQS